MTTLARAYPTGLFTLDKSDDGLASLVAERSGLLAHPLCPPLRDGQGTFPAQTAGGHGADTVSEATASSSHNGGFSTISGPPNTDSRIVRFDGRSLRMEGGALSSQSGLDGVIIPSQMQTLRNMLLDHARGHDVCLVGKTGQGKSHIAATFAQILGYSPQVLKGLFRLCSSECEILPPGGA